MDVGKLAAIVGVSVALSVASERLVEIIKGFSKFLSDANPDPVGDRWRRMLLQLIAVGAGIVTALLTQPAIKGVVPGLSEHTLGIVALGLLASGGSGFWNAILAYVLNLKDIKKAEAKKVKQG